MNYRVKVRPIFRVMLVLSLVMFTLSISIIEANEEHRHNAVTQIIYDLTGLNAVNYVVEIEVDIPIPKEEEREEPLVPFSNQLSRTSV